MARALRGRSGPLRLRRAGEGSARRAAAAPGDRRGPRPGRARPSVLRVAPGDGRRRVPDHRLRLVGGRRAARGGELHGGRRLLAAHLVFFATAALGCGAVWIGGGAQLLTSVMDVTDVATMKAAAAGLPPPVPPWEEFRPVFLSAAVTFGLCALALVAVMTLARSPQRRRSLGVLVVGATMLATMPGVTRSLGVVTSNGAVRDVAWTGARPASRDGA